ncbi:hypothetical protein FD755_024240 [Muntiacus reevesi]|uniref:Uncharacterized protein n=1 Tax=Muntiacus reevesi TaxID=9886 RepID=A0A5N3VCH0_MUNRE|nr:hypothetical protein FD755_024240 [Muntiacus reevesi]
MPNITHAGMYAGMKDTRRKWQPTPIFEEIPWTEELEENFFSLAESENRLLHTIFEEASNVIKEEYTNANQVVFAKRYRISKCTTFKSLHNRMMMKRGYRGSDNRRNIIRYFEQKDSENYRVFERVANILHDDCAFLASLRLTEEGLPFLIRFHCMKEDTESLEMFQNEVGQQLISEKLIPEKLKQFIFDSHSRKLHREFHHVHLRAPSKAPSEYKYTLLRDGDEL